MKCKTLIFVANFDHLENFLKTSLGAIYRWNWSFGTLEALQNRLHIILKYIEWIWEIRIFDLKKNIFWKFSIILKHFLSIFQGFWLCEIEKFIFFSKNNNNIKNLAREILDMHLGKLQLQGFDDSSNTQPWKNRNFSLKKCFFKQESSFKLHEARNINFCGQFWSFQKFSKNIFGCHI